ncbi:MAG: Calx-beta domain-containing protein, partial [Verrucomicrobiota bacterium]
GGLPFSLVAVNGQEALVGEVFALGGLDVRVQTNGEVFFDPRRDLPVEAGLLTFSYTIEAETGTRGSALVSVVVRESPLEAHFVGVTGDLFAGVALNGTYALAGDSAGIPVESQWFVAPSPDPAGLVPIANTGQKSILVPGDREVGKYLAYGVRVIDGFQDARPFSLSDVVGPIVRKLPGVSFRVEDRDVREGVGALVLVVGLSGEWPEPLSVPFSIGGDASTDDFRVATASPLLFPPGATSQTIVLHVANDALDEPREQLSVALESLQGGGVADTVRVGILDDDNGPVIRIGDGVVAENSDPANVVNLPITLSGPSAQEVRVTFTTVGGSATAAADFESIVRTVTFLPGETEKTVAVRIQDDAVEEPTEFLWGVLSDPVNGGLERERASITIRDDDAVVEAFLENEGIVAFEAEHFTENTSRNGRTWEGREDVAGAVGGLGMVVAATLHQDFSTSDPLGGPALTYRMKIGQAGSYRVWLRGYALSGSDDSCFISIDDDEPQKTSVNLYGHWQWRTKRSFYLTPGAHQFRIGMREDGFLIDRVVLALDREFQPEGAGPGESARVPVENPPVDDPPVADPPVDDPGGEEEPPAAFSGIMVEAEEAFETTERADHLWLLSRQSPGFVGQGAMVASPNVNLNVKDPALEPTPEMKYRISFPEAGTYFFWIRFHAASTADDSVHFGFNGAVEKRFSFKTHGRWAWLAKSINVATPGEKTLSLWMREDGVAIDRMLFTPDSTFEPEGAGPLPVGADESKGEDPGEPDVPIDSEGWRLPNAEGLIAFEAETPDQTETRGAHQWLGGTHDSVAVLSASPNVGFSVKADPATLSPGASYRIELPVSGRHYLWVRAWAGNSSDDSIHFGMDGEPQGRFSFPVHGHWSWYQRRLTVAERGRKTLTIWMREDGAILD